MIRLTSLLCAATFCATSAAAGQQQTAPKPADRVALERQVRERAAKFLQERLGLSNTQMVQLERSNQKYAPQHAQVVAQERDTRRQLRTEMQAAAPNQQRVSNLLDTSLRLQRQRLAIVEAEQKELATFMTPVQRARYLAFQVQLRRRAEELSGRNGARRGGNPNRGPGPRRLP